jgi:flagellar biosynthesis/type III secretory pathway protein FliH
VKEWTEQWKQDGLREGLEQGLQQGLQQGLEQGLRQARQRELGLVLRQLHRRLGTLPAEVTARIEEMPVESIEALGEDLLDFASPADLETWLARH